MTIHILTHIAVFIIGSWVGWHAGAANVMNKLTPQQEIFRAMQNNKGEEK